ncbi:hypothetical protein GW17_00060354 [Ensete ventricosum]|nr:hypothetical protein GW17_00060354 [Ensete ventricosum]
MEGKAFKALMDIQLSHNCDLIMIAQCLAEERQHFFVSREYELHGLLPGQRSYDAFSDGFGLSIDALEARLWFLLHLVIEACLVEWGISLSQMAPNSWRYLMAFSGNAMESELVEKLKGILPDSRAIKDMTNAWLVEAGFSLTPRDMVDLLGMKDGSASYPTSQPVQTSRERTPTMVTEKHPAEKALSDPTEKCPTEGGGEPSAKRKKQMAKKTEKCHSSQGEGWGSAPKKIKMKGKGLTKKAVEPAKKLEGPCRLPTMKEIYVMGGRVGNDKYFTSRGFKPRPQ